MKKHSVPLTYGPQNDGGVDLGDDPPRDACHEDRPANTVLARDGVDVFLVDSAEDVAEASKPWGQGAPG